MGKLPSVIMLLLLPITNGCSSNDKEEKFYIDQYFDLKSLIDKQITYYKDSATPESLTKTVGFESASETKEQDVKKIDELEEILETSIINKPGLRGVYQVEWDYGISSAGDTTYSVQTNTLKSDEEALVEELSAFYTGPPKHKNLHKVHIYKNTDNILYSNKQIIVIELKKGLVRSLKMQGWQQILKFQPEQYQLSLKIKP